jgi:hypothetical protein
MSQVELNLKDLSAPELVAIGNRLIAGLEGNPHFPAPALPLDELKRKLAALDEANEVYRQERLRLTELKTQRETMIDGVRKALNAEAAYVQEASGGDAKKIISANLCAERTWNFWPFGSLAQVVELSSSIGEQPGEIDLVWDRVRGADGYEVECTSDLAGEGPWTQCAVASESRVKLKGLDGHRRYWFRVRAIGEKGEGDWSDPVTKYAR